MSWVKLDDQFFVHRKVVSLSKDAKLLHLAAMTYCGAQSPEGVLTPPAVRIAAAMVDVKPAVSRDLVKAGLWEEAEGGNYQIHDYNTYNPTPEQVEAKKKAAAERQQRFRERHNNAVSNAVTNDDNSGSSNGMSPRARAGSPSPSPFPASNEANDTRVRSSRSKKDELPPDVLAAWETNPHWKQAAEAKGDEPDVRSRNGTMIYWTRRWITNPEEAPGIPPPPKRKKVSLVFAKDPRANPGNSAPVYEGEDPEDVQRRYDAYITAQFDAEEEKTRRIQAESAARNERIARESRSPYNGKVTVQ